MTGTRIRSVILILAATGLAGCRTQAEMNAVFAKAVALRTAPEYTIGESDTVTIRVLDDATETLAISTIVRPDGKISFPEHGDIDVLNKTAAQLRSELETQFQKTLGLKSPKVFVAVTAFDSKTVTVLGEVRLPGRYPYTGQMRVTDLLGLTRGVVETGSPNRALLFREVEGEMKVYHVKLKDFLVKADFSTNYFIRPGDLLYVPQNGFSLVAEKIRVGVSPITALLSFLSFGSATTSFFVP